MDYISEVVLLEIWKGVLIATAIAALGYTVRGWTLKPQFSEINHELTLSRQSKIELRRLLDDLTQKYGDNMGVVLQLKQDLLATNRTHAESEERLEREIDDVRKEVSSIKEDMSIIKGHLSVTEGKVDIALSEIRDVKTNLNSVLQILTQRSVR